MNRVLTVVGLWLVGGLWVAECATPSSVEVVGHATNLNASVQVKFLEATLVLYAPDSWVQAYKLIPETEVICLLNLTHDAAKLLSHGSQDEVEEMVKQDCPAGFDQVLNLCKVVNATFSSLPNSLMDALKMFQANVEAAKEEADSARNSTSVPDQREFRELLQSVAAGSAQLVSNISTLSAADKAAVSAAFPKLTDFIEGAHADAFQDALATVLAQASNVPASPENASAGIDAFQESLSALRNSYRAVIQDYLNRNQAYVDQAMELTGIDFATKLKNGQAFGQILAKLQETSQNKVGAIAHKFRSLGEKVQNISQQAGDFAHNQASDFSAHAHQFGEAIESKGDELGEQAKEELTSIGNKAQNLSDAIQSHVQEVGRRLEPIEQSVRSHGQQVEDSLDSALHGLGNTFDGNVRTASGHSVYVNASVDANGEHRSSVVNMGAAK